MDTVATLPAEERIRLFQETANRRGISDPIIIEKDFWVCWTLKRLFGLAKIGPHLLFKGGTTLSKVFRVIHRFSEDVDLSIDREYLGFGGDEAPERSVSRKQAKKQLEALQEKCTNTIANELLPSFRMSAEQVLGKGSNSVWDVTRDPVDPQTVLFNYPTLPDKAQGLSYIQPMIRIELGARSDHWPAGDYDIHPYAAEEFPEYFQAPHIKARVLEAERTFWEKATILHGEYHRPETASRIDRLSRHYYDLSRLAIDVVGEKALRNLDLLKQVADHKKLFFPAAWAKYEEARPGTLRLVPPERKLPALRNDYEKMKVMFFQEPPVFDDILVILKELEDKINSIN